MCPMARQLKVTKDRAKNKYALKQQDERVKTRLSVAWCGAPVVVQLIRHFLVHFLAHVTKWEGQYNVLVAIDCSCWGLQWSQLQCRL